VAIDLKSNGGKQSSWMRRVTAGCNSVAVVAPWSEHHRSLSFWRFSARFDKKTWEERGAQGDLT